MRVPQRSDVFSEFNLNSAGDFVARASEVLKIRGDIKGDAEFKYLEDDFVMPVATEPVQSSGESSNRR